jgi:hypothetical protein
MLHLYLESAVYRGRSPFHQMYSLLIDKGVKQTVSQHPAFVFCFGQLMPHPPMTSQRLSLVTDSFWCQFHGSPSQQTFTATGRAPDSQGANERGNSERILKVERQQEIKTERGRATFISLSERPVDLRVGNPLPESNRTQGDPAALQDGHFQVCPRTINVRLSVHWCRYSRSRT